MFDFKPDRLLAHEPTLRVVSLCQENQSLEACQRDIYESHRHRTFALAYYMTGNEVVAEQILTSTFVRAFQAVQEPDGRDVDAALLEELRKRSLFDQHPESAPPLSSTDFSLSTEALSNRNVKRTELEEAMWSLPPAERLLFLLRDVEGYTPAAIADLLDMPTLQVQRGLLTARIKLRGILRSAQNEAEEAA